MVHDCVTCDINMLFMFVRLFVSDVVSRSGRARSSSAGGSGAPWLQSLSRLVPDMGTPWLHLLSRLVPSYRCGPLPDLLLGFSS